MIAAGTPTAAALADEYDVLDSGLTGLNGDRNVRNAGLGLNGIGFGVVDRGVEQFSEDELRQLWGNQGGPDAYVPYIYPTFNQGGSLPATQQSVAELTNVLRTMQRGTRPPGAPPQSFKDFWNDLIAKYGQTPIYLAIGGSALLVLLSATKRRR